MYNVLLHSVGTDLRSQRKYKVVIITNVSKESQTTQCAAEEHIYIKLYQGLFSVFICKTGS